ncbi:MAG TPA: radical SAM protein [Smithella sp.]|nr:radical SAM protein [Smithella sp.]HNY51147.1 radical SAM protein [Smithella sp.]HOG90575.1 radical SAM protein [Smithella sp.]HOU50415.1 radical SAM protein [Smithella sp.]HQG64381.1 radical SAM protein [Smithella sp.]
MKTAIDTALGLIRSKYFSAPFYLHFYVTERCNLRCRMCNIWKRKSEEMSLEKIEQCAKVLKALKVQNIVLTGGEPLLRPDISDIVSLFDEYGFTMRLQTNGTLVTKEKIKRLARAGLENITISLDTLDKNKFDWICGSRDLVRKVKESLDIFAEYMKGFIVVNTAVSRINIAELPDLVRFVHSKGAYASLVPVHLQADKSSEGFCYGYQHEMLCSNEDLSVIEKVYAELLKMKKEGYRIINSQKFLRASQDYFRTGHYAWNCRAGERFFVVYPDGGVAPCDIFPPLCNIQSDFLKIFRSAGYQESVRRMRKGCDGCLLGCWRETNLLIDDFATQREQMHLFLRKKTGTHHP